VCMRVRALEQAGWRLGLAVRAHCTKWGAAL